VVTSDRRTLAGSLSPGTRVVDVPEFFHGICRRIRTRPEKWGAHEGLEDVERHFLSRSPHPEDRELAPGGETDATRRPDDDGDPA
jgi:hypothetical protein